MRLLAIIYMGCARGISTVSLNDMPTPGMEARRPSVAGLFYPSEPEILRAELARMLSEVPIGADLPKALIAPHAGYIYSGPIAASAYAQIASAHAVISRVVLLGPAHRAPIRGLAAPSANSFLTPLGHIPVDREAVNTALAFPQVEILDSAFDGEHCLEVQLPFLQHVLDDFSIVPLLVGSASGDQVADVLRSLWGGPETLVVVSSDLSHYCDYDRARQLDSDTSRAIENLAPDQIDDDGACGRQPVKGLLKVAQEFHLLAKTIDLRNSGDTAGPRGEVVGYGAYLFTPAGGAA